MQPAFLRSGTALDVYAPRQRMQLMCGQKNINTDTRHLCVYTRLCDGCMLVCVVVRMHAHPSDLGEEEQ